MYLNYGLLGLCTILKNKGYDIKQFQGEYLTPEEMIDVINSTEYNFENITYPVLISMISFLSLDWCRKITKILKHRYGVSCIVGGKYVVDGNVEWLKEKLPDVDLFVEGEGEEIIEKVIKSLKLVNNRSRDNFDYYTLLDYSILYDYEKYNPSIEVARGCGRGCAFCADGSIKSSTIKKAHEVIREIDFINKTYNNEPFNLYYQMATFQVNNNWITEYEKLIGELDNVIEWRCTSRVDAIDSDLLPSLSKIGLKVLDLGLESASFQQLKLMKKTNNPEKYLKCAEDILHIAYNSGVWVKLNILLTAGETLDTVNETKCWLIKNKKYIKGVSVNCETIYGPQNNFMEQLKLLGASYVNKFDLQKNGFAHINLSDEIDFQSAQDIANSISKLVMTSNDYYELKKFGYFARNYTKKDFYNDIKKSDINKLPFIIEKGI